MRAHAERAGFVRERVKRRAYRHGYDWVDGLLYAVVAEDLERRWFREGATLCADLRTSHGTE